MWHMVIYKPELEAQVLKDLETIDNPIHISRPIGFKEIFKEAKVNYTILLLQSAGQLGSKAYFGGFDNDTVLDGCYAGSLLDPNGGFLMDGELTVVSAIASMTQVFGADKYGEHCHVLENAEFVADLGEAYLEGYKKGLHG